MLSTVLGVLQGIAGKLGLSKYKYGVAMLVGGVMFVLWLIPTVVGGFFDLVWFVIKFPFRLIWLIIVDGIFAFLKLLWGLFSGFFGLFGIVGTILQWLIVVAAVVGLGIFLLLYFFEDKNATAKTDPKAGPEAQEEPKKEVPEKDSEEEEGPVFDRAGSHREKDKEAPSPKTEAVKENRFRPMLRFGQRRWALDVIGVDKTATPDEIKKQYRELIKQYHPDRLPADTTMEDAVQASLRMELIRDAYNLLMEE